MNVPTKVAMALAIGLRRHPRPATEIVEQAIKDLSAGVEPQPLPPTLGAVMSSMAPWLQLLGRPWELIRKVDEFGCFLELLLDGNDVDAAIALRSTSVLSRESVSTMAEALTATAESVDLAMLRGVVRGLGGCVTHPMNELTDKTACQGMPFTPELVKLCRHLDSAMIGSTDLDWLLVAAHQCAATGSADPAVKVLNPEALKLVQDFAPLISYPYPPDTFAAMLAAGVSSAGAIRRITEEIWTDRLGEKKTAAVSAAVAELCRRGVTAREDQLIEQKARFYLSWASRDSIDALIRLAPRLGASDTPVPDVPGSQWLLDSHWADYIGASNALPCGLGESALDLALELSDLEAPGPVSEYLSDYCHYGALGDCADATVTSELKDAVARHAPYGEHGEHPVALGLAVSSAVDAIKTIKEAKVGITASHDLYTDLFSVALEPLITSVESHRRLLGLAPAHVKQVQLLAAALGGSVTPKADLVTLFRRLIEPNGCPAKLLTPKPFKELYTVLDDYCHLPARAGSLMIRLRPYPDLAPKELFELVRTAKLSRAVAPKLDPALIAVINDWVGLTRATPRGLAIAAVALQENSRLFRESLATEGAVSEDSLATLYVHSPIPDIIAGRTVPGVGNRWIIDTDRYKTSDAFKYFISRLV